MVAAGNGPLAGASIENSTMARKFVISLNELVYATTRTSTGFFRFMIAHCF